MKLFRTIVASIAVLALFVAPSTVSAAGVDDFVVTDFAGRYELFNDVRGGRLNVTETIQLNFAGNNHGILRAIPLDYKNVSLGLNVASISRDGTNEPYTRSDQNGNAVLKIGDAAKTITGEHTYKITYEMKNIITFYEAYDEWYWDINGTEWQIPFEAISGEVVFPVGWSSVEMYPARCFTGTFGGTLNDCTLEQTENGYTFATTRTLQAYESLTVATAAQKGLFQPRTFADWLAEHWKVIVGVIVPPLLIGGWAFRKWYKNGKDLHGRGTIIPEYGPPEGLGALEAATIMSYGVAAKDVSATIIDLAIRKYVKIHEITKKKLLKDQKTYEFELLHTDWTELKEYEVSILNGIFADKTVAATVSLDSLKSTFYKTIQGLQSSIPKDLTKQGYFTSNPRHAGSAMYAFGVLLLIAGFVLLAFAPGFIIAGIIVIIFAALMPKRSVRGVSAKEQLEGLKLYMTVAEKDRIKMLQSPDAKYASKTSEPKRTVELFEKLLPFAMILGVEQGWAGQFKDIYNTPPDWYSGNWSSFNAVVLANSLHGSVGAMGSNFAAPSSSGSSGISGGGGFSGGGGGGGGGGGW